MSSDPGTKKPLGRPTLRTISEMSGFAVTTVSRALADDPRIAQSTRTAVAEIARSVGYVPDRAARRLRTGRTQVVSLLLNTEHEFLGFTHEILAGITGALRGTGYSVTVVPDSLGEDRLEPVRTILRNNLADGLLFTRTECFDARARLLMDAGFPFVSHGRTEFTEPHPWVDYDNEAYARAAVARLVEKGRRRLALVPPEDRFTFSQHLRFGFLSAARMAGVGHEIAHDVTIDSALPQLADALRARHRGADAPDAYVCVGEATALVALGALSDVGVVPGRDVDVISKRASPIFSHIRPRIETLFEDVRTTGRIMAEMLLRRMAGEPPEGLHHLFEAEGTFSPPR